MNVAKLKGKMRERNVTQEEMAKKLGIALSTMNRKLQDDAVGGGFTVGEAHKMYEVLELSNDEAVSIFFGHSVA